MMTRLAVAAGSGDIAMMKSLLAAGADPRLRDEKGRTALHVALLKGQESAANLLVEADNANDLPDEDGRTPTFIAAARGYEDIVEKLVEGGADVHVKDRWNNSLVHAAACGGDFSLLACDKRDFCLVN